jgi:hypothetical protein
LVIDRRSMSFVGARTVAEQAAAVVAKDHEWTTGPVGVNLDHDVDLVAVGKMTTDKVVYLEERLTGKGKMPRSFVDFEKKESVAEKLAVFLPVTNHLIADKPAFTAYLEERLSLFYKQGVEGLVLQRIGKTATVIKQRLWETRKAVIKRATRKAEREGGLKVDRVVNEKTIKPMVGAFREGAQVWTKGSPTIEVSNQHASYFEKALTAVRLESMVCVTVYRPQAFVAVKMRKPS